MSTQITSVQEYLREIEAEMQALRAKVRAHEEGARLKAPSAEAATVGGIPVMHFHGPVEPFTLTARQLETVRACWNEVQGFLVRVGGMRAEQVENPARPPGTKESSKPEDRAPESGATLGVPMNSNPNGPQRGAYSGAHHPLETGTGERSTAEVRPPIVADLQTDERDLPVRDRLNYGISRIDQPEKANHGWYVRITKKGHTEQKFFADKSFGGRDPALENARVHRDLLKEKILGIPPSARPMTTWESREGGADLSHLAPESAEIEVPFESLADEEDDGMKI
jgi:hypothetical protein